MRKQLHLFLFLLLILFFTSIFSQNNRVKSTQKPAVIDYNNSTAVIENKVNIPEKKEISKPTKEIKKNMMQKSVIDTSNYKKINKTDNTSNVKLKSEESELIFDSNVTYIKEEPTINSQNTISEKERVKVKPSVNYKERKVKEDIHSSIILIPTSNTISPDKKVYLQQEYDDLLHEISLNKNNPNYNIIEKQKKLDEIKKMLQ